MAAGAFWLVVLLASCSGGLSEDAASSDPPKDNSAAATAAPEPLVFQGQKAAVTLQGETRHVATFKGIQYGHIPARFSPAEPKTHAGSVTAQEFGVPCPQRHNDGALDTDEACLFLNVYRPVTDEGKTESITSEDLAESAKLPIYVFIHGGSFLTGSGSRVEPLGLAAFGDVVVVTFNYRLGVLGFLTTESEHIPANLGLQDQMLAIQWVKNHADYFGGDPDKITVGGQSAGSYSALMHASNAASKGLFQNVVGHSGFPIAKRVGDVPSFKLAVKVAKFLNCSDTGDKEKVKNCLVNATLEDLLSFPKFDSETRLLTMWPSWEHRDDEAFLQKNLLVGYTEDDGNLGVKLTAQMSGGLIPPAMAFQLLSMMLTGSAPKSLVVKSVLDRYKDWEHPESLFPSAVRLFTDFIAAVPAIDTALGHFKEVPTEQPTTVGPTEATTDATDPTTAKSGPAETKATKQGPTDPPTTQAEPTKAPTENPKATKVKTATTTTTEAPTAQPDPAEPKTTKAPTTTTAKATDGSKADQAANKTDDTNKNEGGEKKSDDTTTPADDKTDDSNKNEDGEKKSDDTTTPADDKTDDTNKNEDGEKKSDDTTTPADDKTDDSNKSEDAKTSSRRRRRRRRAAEQGTTRVEPTKAPDSGSSYLYVFKLPEALKVQVLDKLDPNLLGTPHASDLRYFLGDPGWLDSDAKQILSRKTIDYLAGFIKSGKPTVTGKEVKQMTKHEQNYIEISNELEPKHNPSANTYHFVKEQLKTVRENELQLASSKAEVQSLQSQLEEQTKVTAKPKDCDCDSGSTLTTSWLLALACALWQVARSVWP